MDLSGAIADAKYPTVVLSRRDWDFLFGQLKSTYAVIEYLKRVSTDDSPPELDHDRYYQLAAADAATPPGPADRRFMGPGSLRISAPLLPLAPAGQQNQIAHALLRVIMEDIATSPIRPGVPEAVSGSLETMRLEVLSTLDHLPVAYREDLGSTIRAYLDDVTNAGPDEVCWRFRRFIFGDQAPQLAFGAASRYSEAVHAGFEVWMKLRHTEFCRRAGKVEGMKTVGGLLTPRTDGVRPWDTTCIFIEGDLGLTAEDEQAMLQLWPAREG